MLFTTQVAEVYTDHATIESKGKQISRNATEDNPAYYVERHGQGSGNPVLKKRTELHKLDTDENVIPFPSKLTIVFLLFCWEGMLVLSTSIKSPSGWIYVVLPGPHFGKSGDRGQQTVITILRFTYP
jgi:hypothetical protein